MSTEAPSLPRPNPPVGAIVVFVFAAVLYLAFAACISDLIGGGQDAFGRGLASAFAVLFGIGVWILLGVLLLIGGLRGEMPDWAGITAGFLWLFSAISAAIALDLGDERSVQWVYAVPLALPPLIAAYALWARLVGLHRALPPTVVSVAMIGAIAALTLAPLPTFITRQHAAAQLRAERRAEEREQAAADEKRHAKALAGFRKLTPESPLWDWAKFLGKDSEFDQQAIDGAKRLTHLQTDSEEALRRDMGFPLNEFYRLDLKATPALCDAARDFLIRAANARQTPSADPNDRSTEEFFDPDLGGVEWLTQMGCDLDGAVARIEQVVLAAPQTGSRDAFLGILEWRRANGFMKRKDYPRAYGAYTAAIRYTPDMAQFYADRADILYDQEKYAEAVADYTEAVKFNPGYSDAYNLRGLSYHYLGDDDKALADYGQAIEHNSQFARAYDNRGRLYLGRGDLDKAADDLSEAIRIAPRFADALFDRGRTRFHQASYLQASDDLGAALALLPKNAYVVLWAYLARDRAGQPAREPLTADAAKVDRAEWPWPIVAAYLGETDQAAVLAASRGNNDQECEANFYFGAKAEGADPAAARNLLQQAATGCPPHFIERLAASLEVEKLSR